MKEVEYDGLPIKETSTWEKKYEQNKLAKDHPFRMSHSGGIIQNTRSLQVAQPERIDDSGEEMHLGKIIFVLVLVLAFGMGVGIYALIGTRTTIPFLNSVSSTSTITVAPPEVTDEDFNIILSDSPRPQILADILIAFEKAILPVGSTREMRFLVSGVEKETRLATTKEFFQKINKFPGGDAFVRSLDTTLRYEVGMAETRAGRISILSRSYPNTFAAMLDWESVIAQDLLPVLHPSVTQNKLKEVEGRVFHDERISGIDARVLSDAMGNTLIVYGFIDAKTLVIAGEKGLLLPINQLSVEK